jgi:hypothetical protein
MWQSQKETGEREREGISEEIKSRNFTNLISNNIRTKSKKLKNVQVR